MVTTPTVDGGTHAIEEQQDVHPHDAERKQHDGKVAAGQRREEEQRKQSEESGAHVGHLKVERRRAVLSNLQAALAGLPEEHEWGQAVAEREPQVCCDDRDSGRDWIPLRCILHGVNVLTPRSAEIS